MNLACWVNYVDLLETDSNIQICYGIRVTVPEAGIETITLRKQCPYRTQRSNLENVWLLNNDLAGTRPNTTIRGHDNGTKRHFVLTLTYCIQIVVCEVVHANRSGSQIENFVA